MLYLDYTVWVVLSGALILGLVSGSLGGFAVLRKQSLLGDAISHAALPGVGIAFLMTLEKHAFFLLLGAFISGWAGTLLVMAVTNRTSIKMDAALGIILSVFFGFGLVILTLIQRIPTANQSGLTTFLFGSASTLLIEDVTVMIVLGVLCLSCLLLFWKEFKLLAFDQEYAQSLGFPVKRLEVLMITLIVTAIVIGLQMVGVVLMSAMIIAPASAARQWTDKLSMMLILSALFGAFSGILGALISSEVSHLPTGPTIVVVVSIIVFVSILFAPNRGVVWESVRSAKSRSNIRATAMLSNLQLFASTHADPFHPHDIAALTAVGRGPAKKALKELERRGLAKNPENDLWALTPEGLQEAKKSSEEMFGEMS